MADRHPSIAQQRPTRFAGLAADRHPPIAQQRPTRFAGRAAGPEPIETVLQIGTEENDLALAPRMLRFEKGKLYKLVMVNSGKITHHISAPEFGAAIDSTRLLRSVELKPGDSQVWYFAADREGVYRIGCGLKAHAKAGMVGKIIVVSHQVSLIRTHLTADNLSAG